jgi:hypothetical protein
VGKKKGRLKSIYPLPKFIHLIMGRNMGRKEKRAAKARVYWLWEGVVHIMPANPHGISLF